MSGRLALLLCCLTLASCAPPASQSYSASDGQEEIVSLLNNRQYDRAIWLIENQEGRHPQGQTAFLLGEAYLGRAGIEPLDFAAKVAGPEPDNEASRTLFPDCPKGQVAAVSAVPLKCLLKRVYLFAPKADSPDFQRARELLEASYPDPAASPVWVNTLVGLADTVSLVSRAGDLFLYGKGVRISGKNVSFNPADIPWLQEEAKASLQDAKRALARANHSGEKISRFLAGTRANEWFDRLNGTIGFAKNVGLSRFLDFVRAYLLKPSDEIRYGETLDNLKQTLELVDHG